MLALDDQVSFYCPKCQCPECLLITRAEQLKQQRLDEVHARAQQRELEQRRRVRENADEFRRECAMVWMLVNNATDQNGANWTIQKLAEALLLSPAQVNTRRSEYARTLTQRAKTFTGEILAEPTWASLPGTKETELPDYCEKCGGMKTMGRKCKRCDYRRSKKR